MSLVFTECVIRINSHFVICAEILLRRLDVIQTRYKFVFNGALLDIQSVSIYLSLIYI